MLQPGMTGYPSLETRTYKWTVLVSGWTWRTYHVMPDLPPWAVAIWNSNTLELSWGPANGAELYSADIGNVFVKDYTQEYPCSGVVCSGTSNVSQIPFGTILVAMRSCGIHGRCTTDGTKTETYRAPPNGVEAPVILLPEENSTVSGGMSLIWLDKSNIERWNVRIEKDSGGPTMLKVTDEAPWRTVVQCGLNLCSRPYVLVPGSYLLTMTAYSGGIWGPSKTIAFNIDSNNVTPKLMSPIENQSTSIYPLFAWKRVAGVNSYELAVTSGGSTTTKVVNCSGPLCSYDSLKENWPLAPGTYTWTARVNVQEMPMAAVQSFTTSYAYVPPAPEIAMPVQNGSIGPAKQVTAVFIADVQVPTFSAQVDHTSGYNQTSPLIHRYNNDCKLIQVGTGIKQSCSYQTPVYCNQSNITIKTHTYTNLSGANSTLRASDRHYFTRTCEEDVNYSGKAIYTIFAQNTQFLSIPILGDNLQSVYNMTHYQRSAALAQYLIDNQFDVVALEELFNPEAQDVLGWSFNGIYDSGVMIGRIDTAGDPLFTIREGFPHESVSGLAIYSKFQPQAHTESWNSNSQCTNDLFNQISETYTLGTTRPTPLNDYLWFNQYCEAEGMDALAGKGMAAIRLNNPMTGVPLLIAWSHTQAMTNQGPLSELGLPLPNDYSYKDSHEKREKQLQEARDSLNHVLGLMPAEFDAFILGDWNLPQPKSISNFPTWDGITQTDGRPNLTRVANPGDKFVLYNWNCAEDCSDQKNPSFSSLAGGEYDPTPDGWKTQNLYSQYWKAFDPRNDGTGGTPGRYFSQFYDLWLEQPEGDWGFTYDRTHAPARCDEAGEPCHGRNGQGFDHGQRYDLVMARLHASVMPNHRNTGNYPANGTPFANKKSCIQHVRIAKTDKDWKLSDHFGTIIEVGPEALYCSPMKAKAAAQKRRAAGAPPPPNNDETRDKYLGVHNGNFALGGANEWLFISEAGGYDFIHESGQRLWIEAYQPNDLSTPMNVADSTQTMNGILGGDDFCNQEMNDNSIEQNGYITKECARENSRVTYKSPGPFFARIYPVNPDGKRCFTCTGNYRVRIRARSCKVVHEAVPTFPTLINPKTDGWMGPGQTNCWFSVELREPTQATDFQTFMLGDLLTANASRCAQSAGPGTCSSSYTARVYHKEVADLQIAPHELPPIQYLINGPLTHNVNTNGSSMLAGVEWDIPARAQANAQKLGTNNKPKGDYRSKYLWVVQRSDSSKKHELVLPWVTNLKSATFKSITAIEIDDDDKVIVICVPFVGCFPIKDPFQTEDEVGIELNVNNSTLKSDSKDMEKDAVYEFPNTWPGAPSGNETGAYYPNFHGYTVNFTGSAWVRAHDEDDDSGDDWLVADHLMVPTGTTGSYDKQTNEIVYFKITEPDLRLVPFTWEFTDTGTGVFGGKLDYRVLGTILRDQ